MQLSTNDFRRLCILKGIYPRDPRHKNKIAGAASNKKSVYLLKDIQFLAHEPLLNKFRELKAFHRRLRKYIGKRAWAKVDSLERHIKPEINLDHLVRERYPSFVDAIRDLDDPLSMLALFSALPRTGVEEHQAETSRKCARLMREFEAYVVATGSLRRSFISIKGIYYQADILGQPVTWVVPHEFSMAIPTNVDFQVMLTFLEFYMTLMRFVNYRLFTRLGWAYPQNFIEDGQEVQLSTSHPAIANPDEIFPEGDHRLLSGAKIFISREVPRKALSFVLQSMGAEVSFALEEGNLSLLTEDDPNLTHQIVDRPALSKMFTGREYVQPQWVFDSLNAKQLVDMTSYRIGATLPPHLSPFVTATHEEEDEPEEEASEAEAEEPTTTTKTTGSKKKKQFKAQKELAVSMLSKKRQKLYHKMQATRQKQQEEKQKLREKKRKLQSEVSPTN